VLEPQDWASYTRARRMSPELRTAYDQLELRPDDFERVLLDDIGFEKVERLGTVGKGGKREGRSHGTRTADRLLKSLGSQVIDGLSMLILRLGGRGYKVSSPPCGGLEGT
jgi:hypothetical protein